MGTLPLVKIREVAFLKRGHVAIRFRTQSLMRFYGPLISQRSQVATRRMAALAVREHLASIMGSATPDDHVLGNSTSTLGE